MNAALTAGQFSQAVDPLPRDRVQTMRTLLRLTDALRAHVLGGRIAAADGVQGERDELLRQFFAEAVTPAERNAMIEACCAMLDMDRAVLECLKINRRHTAATLMSLVRDGGRDSVQP